MMSWTDMANRSSNDNNFLVDVNINSDDMSKRIQNNKYIEEENEDDEYETEDEDNDDDDSYEELDISAWGDTKKEEVGWNTLVDPSIKIKAGGVGSGDLHRRGGNFKPVSEQFILHQRLKKGVPSPSGTKKKKKKKKRTKSNNGVTTTATSAAKPAVFAGNKNKPYAPLKFTTVTQRASIKDPNATAWGKLPLSSTPFWEEKNTNKVDEEEKPEQKQLSERAQPQQTQHSPPPPPPPPSQSKQKLQSHKPLEQTFLPSAADNTWNPEVPNFIPSTSTSTSSTTVKTLSYNAEAPNFVPLYQQPVKKIVKISAPPSTSGPSDADPTTNTASKPLQHVDTSLLRRHLTAKCFNPSTKSKLESQTGPESTRGLEEPVPLLRFNLELAPGVTAMIQAYSDSEPAHLVEQFAQKHQLNMTNTAKENMGKTIKLLMDKKKEALNYKQQQRE